MISYEQDPEVVQWGLQLFDAHPFPNYGYCNCVDQDDANYYHTQCFEQVNCDTELGHSVDEEYMAHALQEQLSQTIAETSVVSHEWKQDLQLPVLSQNWLDLLVGQYDSGQESDQEEEADAGPSSSCSSPYYAQPYCGDELLYSLEQVDEYALNGEVGKRLNQMIPIPHVPRINGEIPSVDEATQDHQRLLDRLQLYELIESKVEGDGNCQNEDDLQQLEGVPFRALSDQIYQTPEHHIFVREQIVNQLKSCHEIYEGYVPMAYEDYLEKMSKSGEWGDHVTLQAAADVYGVKIFVITSFKDTCCIEILPNIERSKRAICLSFWAEVHYNSIYPDGGQQIDL